MVVVAPARAAQTENAPVYAKVFRMVSPGLTALRTRMRLWRWSRKMPCE